MGAWPPPTATPAGIARSEDAAGDALALGDLRKRFGEKVAVDGLSLRVPAGAFYGVVGPNGAGKTTTLKMATGLLRPDAGTVRIEGHDVWADPLDAKRRIGVLPEELHLFDRLTGRQLLVYTGLLRGMEPDVVDERAEQLLEILGLGEAAGTLVVDYSHGMRKKVALAGALLHGPRVLFLDEPFEAIDPLSARTLRGVLERHRDAGGTIVFSSHVMELVERLCDHVAIVHRGRLVAEGTVTELAVEGSLEDAFVEAVGGQETISDSDEEGLGWLGSSSG